MRTVASFLYVCSAIAIRIFSGAHRPRPIFLTCDAHTTARPSPLEADSMAADAGPHLNVIPNRAQFAIFASRRQSSRKPRTFVLLAINCARPSSTPSPIAASAHFVKKSGEAAAPGDGVFADASGIGIFGAINWNHDCMRASSRLLIGIGTFINTSTVHVARRICRHPPATYVGGDAGLTAPIINKAWLPIGASTGF